MPSASDSRQPYRLSNLDLVTESLTLMAGTSSLPCFLHLVEAVNAGGRLFGDAAPFFGHVVPAGGIFRVNLLQQVLDDLFFVAAGRRVDPIAAVFEFIAFVDEKGDVAAVIDDQLAGPCRPDG